MTEAKVFSFDLTDFSPESQYGPNTKQCKVEILTMRFLVVYDLDSCRASLRKEFGSDIQKVLHTSEDFNGKLLVVCIRSRDIML